MTPPPSPETIDRITGIVALYTSLRRIDPNASLRGDLCLDDIDRAGIASDISEDFGLDVSDHDLIEWETVEDIARTVEQLQRLQPAFTQARKD